MEIILGIVYLVLGILSGAANDTSLFIVPKFYRFIYFILHIFFWPLVLIYAFFKKMY